MKRELRNKATIDCAQMEGAMPLACRDICKAVSHPAKYAACRVAVSCGNQREFEAVEITIFKGGDQESNELVATCAGRKFLCRLPYVYVIDDDTTLL